MLKFKRVIYSEVHLNAVIPVLFFMMVLFVSEGLMAQINPVSPFPPPREIKVYNMQGLSFGSFSTGSSGGSITVDYNGSRTSTGSIILVGGLSYQAIFIIELLPGRLVNITLDPPGSVQLQRAGGGGTLYLTIGPTTDRGLSFVTFAAHPFHNLVSIGGILQVGNPLSNPPGEYVGQFNVTFNQE